MGFDFLTFLLSHQISIQSSICGSTSRVVNRQSWCLRSFVGLFMTIGLAFMPRPNWQHASTSWGSYYSTRQIYQILKLINLSFRFASNQMIGGQMIFLRSSFFYEPRKKANDVETIIKKGVSTAGSWSFVRCIGICLLVKHVKINDR